MFKNLFIFAAVLCCLSLNAQNVFSPADPLVTYNAAAPAGSSTHPNTPPGNVMAKWVRTSRMGWSTTNFKSYIWNGMAFRLRFPNNYNPAIKYPVIVFFHGGGEIGPVTDNEFHLLWGAQLFEQRINNGEWNGFLIFPQTTAVGWDDSYFSRINGVLDTLQKYNNADPDRTIAMGLSSGGYGTVAYASLYPKRIAASLASSPAQVRSLTSSIGNFVQIPMWIANGGIDVNPNPYDLHAFYSDFRNAGGNVYRTYYVNDSHNTWTDMWNQKNASGAFISTTYWNSAHKAQPLVYYQSQQFCGTVSARMAITAGYNSYEWQRDGSTIGGASGNEYIATQAGQYRVRFRRNAGGNWSDWTPNPVVISSKTCAVDTLYAEHFTADNYFVSASGYSINNFTCQGGIMTSGTDLITQDATGVQGNRFLVNYTKTGNGCTFAAGDRVWNTYSPVTVLPNTNYEYSFYMANQNATSPAQLAPAINGTPLISGFVQATGTGNTSWKKYTYTWNSGGLTYADLSIINRSNATTGNDFAIDEISFKLAPALPVPGCTVNTAPANGATLATGTTATLSWAAAANAASYDVYLWTGAIVPTTPVANVTTTSYNASALTGSALYNWYVVPKNGSGVAATGCGNNQSSFTTAFVPMPPSCVINTSPVNGSTIATITTATLTWNAAPTAVSYDVYLWTGATAPVTPTATVTGTTCSAAALTASSLYNWYIVPKNAVGSSTGCTGNTTSFTTAALPTAPNCVTNTAPANGSTIATTNTATLTWTAAATATSYDIYLWTGAVAPGAATANVTGTTYSATGLTGASLYNWYVVPKNAVGSSTGCNANATSFTTAPIPTPPACVTNASPVNGSTIATTATATLVWTAAATATTYDVYVWTGATTPVTATATVTGTSYGVTGLSPSNTYNWYVVPKNAVGSATGCNANVTSFTTPLTASNLLGYIKIATDPYGACYDASTAGRIPVYGTGIADGSILYTDPALTTVYNGGWNWFSFMPILGGATTQAFAIYPTGGILLLRSCANGGARMAAPQNTTIEQDIATLKTLKDLGEARVLSLKPGKLAIYPNPVNGGQNAMLQINSDKAGIANVQVLGATGNTVQSEQLNVTAGANNKTIHTAKLRPGIYIIRITGNAGNAATLKLVVH
ncbi:MAG: T9SS type A sorting domain-containing protein [Chitinophagaceae bacterium]